MNRTHLIGLSLFAFLLMFSYALARPAAESLFMQAHGSERLPVVWLLVAVTTIFMVALYDRVVTRFDLVLLFGGIALISALSLAALMACWRHEVPYSAYGIYIWKDLYMVFLVEAYYSYANSIFPLHSARWAYSLFGGVSALSGIVGGALVGPLAQRHDTAFVLWVVSPVLLLLTVGSVIFYRFAGSKERPLVPAQKASLVQALMLLKRSTYLLMLNALIALVQTTSTLIDYLFSDQVETSYPLLDHRTGFIGRVYSLIAMLNIPLNGLTGPILRFFGLPVTLVAIPALLGVTVSAFWIWPVLAMVTAIKVANKCLDYTIFRVAKESLYIPLTYEEITLGKSIIDIATYRVAKGAVSVLMIILLKVLHEAWLTPLTLTVIVAWLWVTVILVKRFRRMISRQQEISGKQAISGD